MSTNTENVGQTPTQDQQLALQKEYKAAKERFRSEIKRLAPIQSTVRNQRRTVKLVGAREIEPVLAQATHSQNRKELRHLYLAYAIMRQIYGGYTKLPASGPGLLKGSVQLIGVSSERLIHLIGIYGPQAVHFSQG